MPCSAAAIAPRHLGRGGGGDVVEAGGAEQDRARRVLIHAHGQLVSIGQRKGLGGAGQFRGRGVDARHWRESDQPEFGGQRRSRQPQHHRRSPVRACQHDAAVRRHPDIHPGQLTVQQRRDFGSRRRRHVLELLGMRPDVASDASAGKIQREPKQVAIGQHERAGVGPGHAGGTGLAPHREHLRLNLRSEPASDGGVAGPEQPDASVRPLYGRGMLVDARLRSERHRRKRFSRIYRSCSRDRNAPEAREKRPAWRDRRSTRARRPSSARPGVLRGPHRG